MSITSRARREFRQVLGLGLGFLGLVTFRVPDQDVVVGTDVLDITHGFAAAGIAVLGPFVPLLLTEQASQVRSGSGMRSGIFFFIIMK